MHAGVTDNAAVTFHPGRVPEEGVAMTEARNGTIRIERSDLSTAGRVPLGESPAVKGALQTAHPTQVPSGESINLHPDIPSGTIQVCPPPAAHHRRSRHLPATPHRVCTPAGDAAAGVARSRALLQSRHIQLNACACSRHRRTSAGSTAASRGRLHACVHLLTMHHAGTSGCL